MGLNKNDLREFLRPKRVLVAERFRGQYLARKPEDLLTGDKEPIPTLPPPLQSKYKNLPTSGSETCFIFQ